MPEGHTIHRIARDHQRWFAGQLVRVDSPQGRFASEAQLLDGGRLECVEAFGKHLFYQWNDLQVVHIHLGLYGKFRIHRLPAPAPRGAVRMRIVGTERAFDLNGPHRCERIDLQARHRLITRLGADPLRPDADWSAAADRIQRSKAEIGRLLLDQSIIAGLGNIYRAEILHRLRIHPQRLGRQVTAEETQQIWELARRWLQIGVKYNRIITVDAETVSKPLGRLRAGERLTVYKRPQCSHCHQPISNWLQAGRTIFACNHCQK